METIITFGDKLLKSGDLDPVYLAMNSASLDSATLDRLCLAYWCFYSLGTASFIAERGTTPKKFWELMTQAAVNEVAHPKAPPQATKPWPRGAERRHFRAANATGPMAYLRVKYKTASAAVEGMTGAHQAERDNLSFASVARNVESHPGFGPWMSFKIADMAERVLGYGVNFDNCSLNMYKDPTQGAAVGYLEWMGSGGILDAGERAAYEAKPWTYPVVPEEISQSVAYYIKTFNKRHKVGSLPGLKRALNIQEIETIFCKYKSHIKGHYPVGKDTREIVHGLKGWGDLAQQLSKGISG